MLPEADMRRVLLLFAEMLDYPTSSPVDAARECQEVLLKSMPRAAATLAPFLELAQSARPGRLEEVYTGYFDLNPVCHPYVGYQLFGETYKRSAFLVGLKERYGAEGFRAPDGELPDRLSVVLRFLAHSHDEDANREMVAEGLIPALERLVGQGEKAKGRSGAGPGHDDIRLEGQSQGEVLQGGFVLEMAQDGDGRDGGAGAEHAYRSVLRALRLVLGPSRRASQPAGAPGRRGGTRHG